MVFIYVFIYSNIKIYKTFKKGDIISYDDKFLCQIIEIKNENIYIRYILNCDMDYYTMTNTYLSPLAELPKDKIHSAKLIISN